MATIAENLQTIIDIKADIKTAIENKGVTVGNASFSEYAGKIGNIEGGGSASVDVGALGLKFAYSAFTEVPSILDFSNCTNMNSMFEWCSNLTSVPLLDTSNVTDMNHMFYQCSNLTSVPLLDTHNVTNMGYMFYQCSNLTSVPLLDTSNVTEMGYMFYYCSNLTSVPLLDMSKVTDMEYKLFIGCSNLTNVGGFINLGKSFTGNYSKRLYLDDTTKLTYQSCMNIINNVYDLNLNTTYTGAGIILFNPNSYLLLSEDDIAIATNKGWSIQAG